MAFDSSSERPKRLQLQSLKVHGAPEAPALGHENHLQTWASPWTNSASGPAQVQVFGAPHVTPVTSRAKDYWLVRHQP